MKSWSMAINEGEGDIETVPEALARTFMPAKPTLKNPLRVTSDKTPTKETNTVQPPSQTSSPHFQFPPPSYPYYPYPSNTQYPQLPPPYIHHQQPMASGIPSTPTIQTSRHRSLSLSTDYDSTSDKLTEYFTWLIKINPTMIEQLSQCLVKLKARDIVYGTVGDI